MLGKVTGPGYINHVNFLGVNEILMIRGSVIWMYHVRINIDTTKFYMPGEAGTGLLVDI